MMFWLRSLIGRYVDDVTCRIGLAARRVALAFAGVVAFLIAAGFLIGALHRYLSQEFGGLAADLSVAGLFLVVGLVLLLFARSGAAPAPARHAVAPPPPPPPPRPPPPPPPPRAAMGPAGEAPPDTPFPSGPDPEPGPGAGPRAMTVPLAAGAFVYGFVRGILRRRR